MEGAMNALRKEYEDQGKSDTDFLTDLAEWLDIMASDFDIGGMSEDVYDATSNLRLAATGSSDNGDDDELAEDEEGSGD
jgi:hypothetical protein